VVIAIFFIATLLTLIRSGSLGPVAERPRRARRNAPTLEVS
jgi:hypothetical protein